jgi:hypothetical protein
LNAQIEGKRAELVAVEKLREKQEEQKEEETKQQQQQGKGKGKLVHGEVEGEHPQRSDGSIEKIIHGVVKIFIQRYQRKHSSASASGLGSSPRAPSPAVVLQPLLRAIKGYLLEKGGKDEITPYALEQLLSDLLIDLSPSDAEVSSSPLSTLP